MRARRKLKITILSLSPSVARCHRYIFFAVLMGICRMAHGDRAERYSGVVTNVLDATHVMLGSVRLGDRYDISRTATLVGIAAPEKGSPEEAALLAILEKTLLGKRVTVRDRMDGSRLCGASIYVAEDKWPFKPEDNVNLMLLREGFARWSGEFHSDDDNLGWTIQDAQRQAQAERKGIWADFEPPPDPTPAVTNAPAEPPQTVPDTPQPEAGRGVSHTPEEGIPPPIAPVANKPTPWKLPLLIGTLILGAVAVWRFLQKKSA